LILAGMMIMKITLLRHGKPAFELKGKVRARELGSIARSYDLSGIADLPLDETVLAVQGSQFVVCSHLPRSIESAKALGFSDIHLQDSLFGETTIPHFSRGSLSLPIGVWLVLLRVLWLFGFSKNGESFKQAKNRARLAADKLIDLAEMHHDVLLVGHGFINHFIAKELKQRGWQVSSKPGRNYWEYGVFKKPLISA